MNLLGIVVLLSGPALGIAWLILEFKGSRSQRLTCGILALIMLTVVTWLATYVLNQMSYNASYGFGTKGLIDETIRGIEAGKSEMVLRELRLSSPNITRHMKIGQGTCRWLSKQRNR